MARQIVDLSEMLSRFVSDDDYLLIRDTSEKEDKRISVGQLAGALFLSQHSVGSVYITYSDSDNPNDRGGVWELASKGRSIIGVDSEDQDFSSPGKKGGSKKHKLTESELPVIDASWTIHGQESGSIFYNKTGHATGDMHSGQFRNANAPSGGAYSLRNPGIKFGEGAEHNNLHPYETAFIWRRVA